MRSGASTQASMLVGGCWWLVPSWLPMLISCTSSDAWGASSCMLSGRSGAASSNCLGLDGPFPACAWARDGDMLLLRPWLGDKPEERECRPSISRSKSSVSVERKNPTIAGFARMRRRLSLLNPSAERERYRCLSLLKPSAEEERCSCLVGELLGVRRST